MTFGAREARFHITAHQFQSQFRPHHARSQAEDVDVVVLNALARGKAVVARGCADAPKLVGRHRRARAAAAHQDRALGAPVQHGLCGGAGEIGIVGRLGRGGAQVQHLVSQAAQFLNDRAFQGEPGMIGGHGYVHPHSVQRPKAPWCILSLAQSMRAILLLPLVWACSAGAAAWDGGGVENPVWGFVFDESARAVRPVRGVPGAAFLGPPVLVAVEAAWAAPGGGAALAVHRGRLYLAALSGREAPVAVEGAIEDADRVAWTPDGSAAAVCSSRARRAQVLRNLRGGTPRASKQLELPGEITALAISGDVLLADSTIFSTLFGGDESLERFWKNLATGK